MGLGYLFDSTLGYPGEGPSHPPHTRRGTRPSLRLWSTKRPYPTLVDPVCTRLVFGTAPVPVVRKPGNLDTSLGRWLQTARTSSPRKHTRCGMTHPQRSSKATASSLPTAVADTPLPVTSDFADVLASTSALEGHLSPPSGAITSVRRSPPRDSEPGPLPSSMDAVDAGSARQRFISKFALQHGVTRSALEAIWGSNKNGYNRAHDAHFDRSHVFFTRTRPTTPFTPKQILPGDLVSFLQHERDAGASFATLKDASASISMACREASDGAITLGDRDSVKRFLKSVRIHAPIGRRKQAVPSYHDVASLFQEAWAFGPDEGLCEGHLKEKLVILLMVDTAARPSDIHRLFRTMTGRNAQIRFEGSNMSIRYFWSKEVDPGSSRTNSTNTYFSSWVTVHGTVPRCTDTVETMKTFLRRTSDPTLYATVNIPELQLASQPLVYARLERGMLQRASVDHISNIVKRAIKDRQMGNMMTAHIRGASVSKIVQLVPELTDQALALGRWTTPYTFRNHYQAPVLGTWPAVPNPIRKNPQQVLRWGWTPTPPEGISIAEYEKPPKHWVGKTIPSLGKVESFDNGDYMINGQHLHHWQFMQLLSDARLSSRTFTV